MSETASRRSRARRWLSVQARAWSQRLARLAESRLALVGLLLVLAYAAMAIAAPWIAPPKASQSSPYQAEISFADAKEAPSGEHPFGTGQAGVDLFYAVVWGSRISIAIGLSVAAAGAAIGTVLGSIAGYVGGVVDETIMRVTDVFLSVPLLVIAMGVSVALGPGLFNITLALMAVWWPNYTRIVRGQVVSIRENAYVEAARAAGASTPRILARHVLPNALSPVVVQATLDIGIVVLVSASLSYIGFGPGEANFVEWGNLVSRGQSFMQEAWWGVTVPGLAIFGFALGFNLLGDGLRDLLDPRLEAR